MVVQAGKFYIHKNHFNLLKKSLFFCSADFVKFIGKKCTFTIQLKPQIALKKMAQCEVVNPFVKLLSAPDSGGVEEGPPKKRIPRESFNIDHAIDLFRVGSPDHCLGGLINVGYNCYINSVLQCLLYTPGFVNYCSSLSRTIYQKNADGHFFLRAFGNLFAEMQKSKSVSPTYFMNEAYFLHEIFRRPIQQDAHEFLLKLLDRMEQEGMNQRSKESITYHYFAGMINTTTTCSKCGKKTITREMFHDIPIAISKEQTVQESVNEFLSKNERTIETVCEKCSKKCTATQVSSSTKLPLILTVTMLRFTKNLRKVDDFLEYPDTLRVGQRGVKYKLYAMIIHEGRLINHGHYISYFSDDTGTWYRADDIVVYKVKQERVMRLLPYVLFYKREYI